MPTRWRKDIWIKDSQAFTSTFFSSKCQKVAELAEWAELTLVWASNRLVILNYLGSFQFEVIVSENSQLRAGDSFKLSEIIVCMVYTLVFAYSRGTSQRYGERSVFGRSRELIGLPLEIKNR